MKNFFKTVHMVSERSFLPKIGYFILLFIFAGLFCSQGYAQSSQDEEDLPSPRGAFLRSVVVPGWGHHYVSKNDWTRGKYHLAGDVTLLLSYLGLNRRANLLENDFHTLALSKAGAKLSNKDRGYLIAVGNYNNLQEYNDAQLQLRNWNNLYPETSEYDWNWESDKLRIQYRDTREKVDRNRSQLPTIVTLMVVNRLVSGISAFVQARDLWENAPDAGVSYLHNGYGQRGIVANLRFDF